MPGGREGAPGWMASLTWVWNRIEVCISYDYPSVFTEDPFANCHRGRHSCVSLFINSIALLANMGRMWRAWEEKLMKRARPLEWGWGHSSLLLRTEETGGVMRKTGSANWRAWWPRSGVYICWRETLGVTGRWWNLTPAGREYCRPVAKESQEGNQNRVPFSWKMNRKKREILNGFSKSSERRCPWGWRKCLRERRGVELGKRWMAYSAANVSSTWNVQPGGVSIQSSWDWEVKSKKEPSRNHSWASFWVFQISPLRYIYYRELMERTKKDPSFSWGSESLKDNLSF